jgi:formylglycine-generating enzyme required for sulfatase activity
MRKIFKKNVISKNNLFLGNCKKATFSSLLKIILLTFLIVLVITISIYIYNMIFFDKMTNNIEIQNSTNSNNVSISNISNINCSKLKGGVWIKVPGNLDLNTSDFCVMKYEAKQNGSLPISEAIKTPWVQINQTNAKIACAALGPGYHLITNAEWTTIARNIENVSENWNTGEVGKGWIYSGHNDDEPENFLKASTNDSNGYYGTGNSAGSNQKRTLKLDNDEIIWDFSGNVWEWNNDTCVQGNPWYKSVFSIEWTDSNLKGSEKTLAGPLGNYTSRNGMGDYYGCTNNGNAFLRGGDYYSDTGAGIFALRLDVAPSDSYYDIGFRCAYTPQ